MPAPKAKQGHQYKYYQGKEVFPVLFDGRSVGKGSYMSAQDKQGNLILVNDKPVVYKQL